MYLLIELPELYGLSPRMPNVRLAYYDVPETYLPYDDSWIRLYPRSETALFCMW